MSSLTAPIATRLVDLPIDVLIRIAVRLPRVEAVARLACTCRDLHSPAFFEAAMRERTARRGGEVPLGRNTSIKRKYIYPSRHVRVFMEDHPRPAGQGALGPLNTILQEGDDVGDD